LPNGTRGVKETSEAKVKIRGELKGDVRIEYGMTAKEE